MRVCCFGTLASRLRNSRTCIAAIHRRLVTGQFELEADHLGRESSSPFIRDARFSSGGFDASDWLKLNSEELNTRRCLGHRRPRVGNWTPQFEIHFAKRRYHCHEWTSGCVESSHGWTVKGEKLPAKRKRPAPPSQVIDTVGAGDAFTAAMVVMHLEGQPLRECARFANHYAARVCEHRGATPKIDRREVELAAFGK